MELPVFVLGKNYSTTLGTVRALGESGHEVFVYFISSNRSFIEIVRSSRYISRFFEHSGFDEENIVRELKEACPEDLRGMILLPTDDFSAAVADSHYDELSHYYRMPYTEKKENGNIVRAMDKSYQMQLARSFGFRTAQSWRISVADGKFELSEDIAYPCFIKPLISFQGGKHGMKKCGSREDLKNELEALRKYGDFDVIVQEYLEIDKEYSISGICFGDQVYLPALLGKIRVSEAHKGTTVCGIIESFGQEPQAYEKLIPLLSGLSLYSIIDVELFRCGEQIYFNEINFRTSAVCYGIVAGGANLPDLFVKAMDRGKFEEPETAVEYGKTFLCEKAAWDDALAGLLSRKQLRELYRKADYYIIRNEADPEPDRLFLRHAAKRSRERQIRRAKRAVKKLLGRA